MGKDSKKQIKTNRGTKLETSQQSNAFIQQVNKQAQILYANNNSKLQTINNKTKDKNYLAIYKKPQEITPIKQTHTLDSIITIDYDFNQKSKKDHHFNLKDRLENKQMYKFPLTSAQQYGWRPPIDIFPTNYGVKATFKQFEVKGNDKPNKK